MHERDEGARPNPSITNNSKADKGPLSSIRLPSTSQNAYSILRSSLRIHCNRKYPISNPPYSSHFPTRSFGTPGVNATFDYVIVGGGTAGLTIATRLVADPAISVAVIEAGGFYVDAGNTSVVPAYCPFFAGTDQADTNPLVDWGFVTTPQQVRLHIMSSIWSLADFLVGSQQ